MLQSRLNVYVHANYSLRLQGRHTTFG
jgi:hypothetical protein